jgi:rRNA maturation RNase YbeY
VSVITVQVAVDPALIGPAQQPVEDLLRQVFAEEGVETAEVTLIFGDDILLNRLKKEFFKVDHLTDVIAFRLNDYSEATVEGEIYISLPRARENAASYQEPLDREVARLIIHGGLHLLNYDDQTDQEQRVMRRKEEYHLSRFPWEELALETPNDLA